jgi:hypothetical protein
VANFSPDPVENKIVCSFLHTDDCWESSSYIATGMSKLTSKNKCCYPPRVVLPIQYRCVVKRVAIAASIQAAQKRGQSSNAGEDDEWVPQKKG